jgi:hypothetical protein
VAGQLGYCGLDRQREPLRGDEIRSCWEAADATGTTVPALPGVGPVWPLDPNDDRTAVRPLQFVEVTPIPVRDDRVPDPTAGARIVPPQSDAEPRWSLWGEAEA